MFTVSDTDRLESSTMSRQSNNIPVHCAIIVEKGNAHCQSIYPDQWVHFMRYWYLYVMKSKLVWWNGEKKDHSIQVSAVQAKWYQLPVSFVFQDCLFYIVIQASSLLGCFNWRCASYLKSLANPYSDCGSVTYPPHPTPLVERAQK